MDDQDNQNEDGMEEDLNAGGTDIPDQALAHFPMEQMIMTTMILQVMKLCRLGITRWKNF